MPDAKHTPGPWESEIKRLRKVNAQLLAACEELIEEACTSCIHACLPGKMCSHIEKGLDAIAAAKGEVSE